MTGDRVYRSVHGLDVSSSFAIAGIAIDQPASIDLTIESVARLPSRSAGDPVILSYEYDDGAVWAVTLADASTLVEFDGIGRFRLSADLELIEVAADSVASAEMTQILLEGWVMAMALTLRGAIVLHATAVEVQGLAIGLLADSGTGKSTTAAMLVRDGATLLTEDVMRVAIGPDGRCVTYPGSTALRLRPSARTLAESIGHGTIPTTADGRLLVRCGTNRHEPVPLAAIYIPMPDRSGAAAKVRWLSPTLASVELNSYPRVYDWQIPEPLRVGFEAAIDIATRVPVGLLSVPWGPPWPTGLLDQLVEAIPIERL